MPEFGKPPPAQSDSRFSDVTDRENALDEALADSFPASDPVSMVRSGARLSRREAPDRSRAAGPGKDR